MPCATQALVPYAARSRSICTPYVRMCAFACDQSVCIHGARASAGYVLAEMAVHQTRAHFKSKLGGKMVDNPVVGATLTVHAEYYIMASRRAWAGLACIGMMWSAWPSLGWPAIPYM